MQFRPSSPTRAMARMHAIICLSMLPMACTGTLSGGDGKDRTPRGGNTGNDGSDDEGGSGNTGGSNDETGGRNAGGSRSFGGNGQRTPSAALGLFQAPDLPMMAVDEPTECPAPGTIVTPLATPSAAFALSCAGCHGPKGQGIGAFPSLLGAHDFGTYRAAVRDGRNDKMPAFGSDQLSDVDLFQDWVTVTGREAKVPPEIACAPAPAADQWSAEHYLEAVTRGLQAWRKPDAHEGAACASCHGPAPFDLAYIGYDDATIMRRALLHVSQADGFAIVRMVHALRAKFALPGGGNNFLAFRPFQPGGRVLGADASLDLRDQETGAVEADHLFGLELKKAMPTLAGQPIKTTAEAERAKNEFLKINPRTFPIAVALNRWTEDKHHGASHASLADWVPDRPHLPRNQAAEKALYAAHDAYLAAPDWEGVMKVENALAQNTQVAATGAAATLFGLKHRSVLYAQHQFLLEAAGQPGLSQMGPAPFPDRNSVWNVGDFARLHRSDARACANTWAGCLDLSRESTDNVDQSSSVLAELERIKFSWFWVGWQFDVSLYNTSQTNSTIAAEYFLEHLYQHQYYNHAWYMRIRKNLAFAYELPGKDGASPAGILADGAQNWSYVFAYGRGLSGSGLPPEGEKRELYIRMMSNAARMMLRLVNAALLADASGAIPAAVMSLSDGPLVQFLTAHGKDASDVKLIEELRAHVN